MPAPKFCRQSYRIQLRFWECYHCLGLRFKWSTSGVWFPIEIMWYIPLKIWNTEPGFHIKIMQKGIWFLTSNWNLGHSYIQKMKPAPSPPKKLHPISQKIAEFCKVLQKTQTWGADLNGFSLSTYSDQMTFKGNYRQQKYPLNMCCNMVLMITIIHYKLQRYRPNFFQRIDRENRFCKLADSRNVVHSLDLNEQHCNRSFSPRVCPQTHP